MVDQLLGGGGQPMNNITEKAIDDLINKLLKSKIRRIYSFTIE